MRRAIFLLTLLTAVAAVDSAAQASAAPGDRALCTINSTQVTVLGRTVTTPTIGVPCP